MQALRAHISFSANLNSNPGLQVSTFSRDARTPEAIKAHWNFKLVTISNSFARTPDTYEEDARYKALGFEPMTFNHQDAGPASKYDSTQQAHRLKAWPLAEIQTLEPSSSQQPHWRTPNRTQDFKFRHSVETRGPPEPRRS
jgi:hypothetical protein